MIGMRPFPVTHPVLAALLGAVLIASGAHAADPPKKKEGAFGKGGGAFLSKEQLRSCLNQKERIAQSDDELLKERAALGGVKDELARGGEALKAKLEAVDRTNAEAVAAYNDDAKARDEQIDAYQKRVEAFNQRVEAAKPEREAYSKACDNRRFFEDDEIAIKKGK